MKKVLLDHYMKRYGLKVSVCTEGKVIGISYPYKGEMFEMTEIKQDEWMIKKENFVFSFTL